MKHVLPILMICGSWLGCGWAEPAQQGPQDFKMAHPEVCDTWQQYLPSGCKAFGQGVYADATNRCVYVLAETTGIAKDYEVEFILLGRLSDRAYEALLVAWANPSQVADAVASLGVPLGKGPVPQRGLFVSRGERFTLQVRPLIVATNEVPTQSVSIAEWISAPVIEAKHQLFSRGVTYLGVKGFDNEMPAAIVPCYGLPKATFGLPFASEQSIMYGQFKCAKELPRGTPCIVTLRHEPLPNGLARVLEVPLEISKQTQVDATVEQLKGLAESPCDVFVQLSFAPTLPLKQAVSWSTLLTEIQNKGGFTLDLSVQGQLPIPAYTPQASWRKREGRLYQPFEISIMTNRVALTFVEEDWSGPTIEPILKPRVIPLESPTALLPALDACDPERRMDAVFYFAPGDLPLSVLQPWLRVTEQRLPLTWIFLDD